MKTVLRFSKNAELRAQQKRFIEFAEGHDDDDEVIEFVAREAAGGAFSFRMASFVRKWARKYNEKDFYTKFLKLLRTLNYDQPWLAEMESTWLWGRGWRELALQHAANSYQRWKTHRLKGLEEVLHEMLINETPEELARRRAKVERIPEDQRPEFSSVPK